MKQSITKSQWDELSEEQKKFLFVEMIGKTEEELNETADYRGKTYKSYEYGKPNIGQMIEFLGDDIYNIHLANAGWGIQQYKGEGNPLPDNWRDYLEMGNYSVELCDALFSAVKSKLENDPV